MANTKLDWDDLPDEPYYAAPTRADIAAFIQNRNRRRWNRLMKDYTWLVSEMKAIGLNPDDARFLL